MVASSANAETLQHALENVSGTLPSVESFTSLSGAVASSMPSAMALANSTAAEQAIVQQKSWFGMFGTMTLFMIKVVPGILYWTITFITITVPTFLFTMFSTSLTFTMNATTLFVHVPFTIYSTDFC